MAELKPCPFCGMDAVISAERRHASTKDRFYFIGCGTYNCIASLHSMNRYNLTEHEAIEAWNRRYEEPKQEIEFDYEAED